LYRAVGRRPLTAETWVHYQARPRGIFGGQSGTRTGSPHLRRLLEISLVVIIPEMLQAQSFFHDRRRIMKQVKASLGNTLKIAASYKL